MHTYIVKREVKQETTTLQAT